MAVKTCVPSYYFSYLPNFISILTFFILPLFSDINRGMDSYIIEASHGRSLRRVLFWVSLKTNLFCKNL